MQVLAGCERRPFQEINIHADFSIPILSCVCYDSKVILVVYGRENPF